MPLPDGQIARRENGRIIIRPAGVRLRWDWADLPSSDGHGAHLRFSLTAKALDEPAEIKMLEEAFLSQPPPVTSAVTSADVAEYFSSALESAARRQTSTLPVAALLADAGQAALLEKLTHAARTVAFGCGLEILAPLELELDSPTYRAQQEQARRSAAQTERLGHASAWFKQFQEIRAAAPDLPPDKIFSRMGLADPRDQTDLLRGLLLCAAQETQARPLWAVAGPHLIRIDPHDWQASAPPSIALFTPPAELGPFRSIQKSELNGKTVLLIGARSGILLVDPAAPAQAALYADPLITSSLGFNAVAIAGGTLWATHAEAGVLGWTLGEPNAKTAIAVHQSGPPISPRNLCLAGAGRLAFSSDNRLFELTIDGSSRLIDSEPAAPVLAIIPESPDAFLIVHENGEICRRDRTDLRRLAQVRRTGKLTAAAGLPWLGAVRLLLATEAGPVVSAGFDDEWVGHFVSNHFGLRQTTAAIDRVAAVSADRQRILLWPTWDGRGPATEINIAALAKHRVADVEFG